MENFTNGLSVLIKSIELYFKIFFLRLFKNDKWSLGVGYFLWLWNILVLVLLLSTAFTMWPTLRVDADAFTPPIIKWASSGLWEWDSHLVVFLRGSDLLFKAHGQFYQWLFGKLLHCKSYEIFFFWVAILNTVSFLCYWWVGKRAFQRKFPNLGGFFATGLASIVAMLCWSLQGRPEHIMPLLFLIPFIFRECKVQGRTLKCVLYVVAGLTIITSPLPGVIFLIGTISWIFLSNCRNVFLEMVLLTLISSSVVSLVLFFTCGSSLYQWLLDTFAYAQNPGITTLAWKVELFGKPMLYHTGRPPSWNVFIWIAMFSMGVALMKKRLWWLALAVSIVVFFVTTKSQVYGFMGFVPVLMISFLSQESSLFGRFPLWIYKIFVGFCFYSFILGFLLMGRCILLFIVLLTSGMSFQKTQTKIMALRDTLKKEEQIACGAHFVAFSEPGFFLILAPNNRSALNLYEAKTKKKIKYRLLHQDRREAPPKELCEGAFVLHEVCSWKEGQAHLMGMTLGVLPGYQFAIYRRVEEINPMREK